MLRTGGVTVPGRDGEKMERCPYCFKPLPESGVCDCRYEESKNAQIEDALHPGAIVGACYQIGAVLGKGGFGITYKAFDLNMRKIVAIKEFYPDGMVTRGKLYGNITGAKISKSEVLTMSESSGEVYRKSLDLFYREAVALGKLDKLPNVVHAHHVFCENGTAYIVMEYVNGQSLKAMVEERGKIPERELLGLLDPVLTALGKVHEANILHRDIAPDNIMIESGNPVLLDFGAARVEDRHHSSLVIGKKGYSSPEQIAGGAIDRRSDIYSMGATYYKALSGITPQDSALRMMNDHVTPLKHLGLGISESVSDAVMKAMSVKPEDRWENAAAFQGALRISATSVKPPVIIDRPRKNLTAIIAAVVLAVLAGGFFLFREKIKPEAKNDPAALTQAAMDAELTKIAEAQTAAAERQTATAQKIMQDAIAAEWVKLTETQKAEQAAQTEAARPTATAEPSNTPKPSATSRLTNTARPTSTPKSTNTTRPSLTPKPSSTPKPTATKTRVLTNTPQPIATPKPTVRPTSVHSAEGMFEMGKSYYSQGNYEEALKYYKAAAVQKHSKAQYALGYMYEKGLGVQQSDEKAVEWYQKAADKGNKSALARLFKLKVQPSQQPATTPEPTATQTRVPTNTAFPTATPKSAVESPAALYGTANNYFQWQDCEKALIYYEQAADLGYAKAQYSLGHMYENGYGVEPSVEKALEWYQKAADQGYPAAVKKLEELTHTPTPAPVRVFPTSTVGPERNAGNGRFYLEKGDYSKALEFFEKAADQGNAEAQYYLGYMYENGFGVEQSWKNWQKAAEWYQKAADQNYAPAQYGLGNLYMYNRGVTVSFETAAEWYLKAAEQGNADAQYQLCFMYFGGLGVEKSEKKAFEWGLKAAEQGHAEAQANTGWMYMNGAGVELSFEKALEWNEKAANQGNPNAQCNLGYMYENGEGVTQSYEKAVEWYQKSADQGYARAQYNLGYMYDTGEGVTQSYEKAVEWYQKAADQGDAIAQCNLGVMYDTGRGVLQSDEKAVEWYQKAADQGYAIAQLNLGVMYYYGQGITQSFEKAVEWYQKAADQGYAIAQFYLGVMYEYGEGVTQSYEKAREWYLKAADQGIEDAKEALERLPSDMPEEEQPSFASLETGDLITFGRYEQDNNLSNGAEPIEWQVLDVQDGQALVISRYGLDAKLYNEEIDVSVTWETSTLRKWLNGEFYETAFRPEEKVRIQQVTNENPDNPEYGTKGGNRTQDRIFLLSIDEVNKYFASNEPRKCWATEFAKENGAIVHDNYGTSWWWLRSPGILGVCASYVNIGGSVGVIGNYVIDGTAVARPAFWLNL